MDRKSAYARVGEDLFIIFVVLALIVIVVGCTGSIVAGLKYGDFCEQHGYEKVLSLGGFQAECSKDITIPVIELMEEQNDNKLP